MTARATAVLAVVAAIGFGAAGYFYGKAANGPGEAEISAAIDRYVESNPERFSAPVAAVDGASDDAMSPAPSAAPSPLAEAQVTAIRQLIRDHLIANPEIIRDAIDELQRKEQEAEVAAQVEAISAEPRLFKSSRQVVLGNPGGDVTLVEFFDYNCGYCKRAHADMKRLLDEDKNLRIVLKEFPVLGEGSLEAGRVGAAVNIIAPDRYPEFHDALISERGQVNGERALAIAGDIGLDVARVQQEIESDEVKATIAEVYELAGKLSLTGTPSYVTAQEVVIGAVGYDALKQKIEEARAACQTTAC